MGRRHGSRQDQRHDRHRHRRAAGNAADGRRAARLQGQSRPRRPSAPASRPSCTKAAAWWPSCIVQNGTLTRRRRRRLRRGLRPRQGDVRHAATRTCTTTRPGRRCRSTSPGLNVAPGRRRATSTCWTTSPRPAQIAEQRAGQDAAWPRWAAAPAHVTLENLFDRLGQKQVQTLNIILRADVRGSIEAIQKELTKLEHPEVQDQGAAGHGRRHHRGRRAPGRRFGRDHHRLQRRARRKGPHAGRTARRADSPLRHHLQDDRRLEGRPWKACSKPEEREIELGRALVQRTFTISRVGTIAGCRVLAGTVAAQRPRAA